MHSNAAPAITGTRMTPMKRKFCDELIRTGNATKAYIKAYNTSNTLRKTVGEAASRLRREQVVRDYLDAHFAKYTELAGVTRQRVIQRAAALAFADVRDLYDERGNLRPVNQLTATQAAMIAGLKVTRDVIGEDDALGITETAELKLVNPVAAVQALGKLMGMEITKTQDVTRGGQFIIMLDD